MKTIHLLILLLFPSVVFSQGLQIQLGGTDITGKTVIRSIEPNHDDYIVQFVIYNNSPHPKTFYPKRILSKPIPDDYTLWFAFNKSHYAPSGNMIQIFPDTVTLQPGEFLDPDLNQEGLTPVLSTGAVCTNFSVACILMNVNQHDSVKITVQYNCTNSIKEEQAGTFSTPYPIPAHTNAFIDYTFYQPAKNASLILYNALGKSVKEISLDNTDGKINIDLNGFPSGFYFYSFINNTRVVHSGKLLVSDH